MGLIYQLSLRVVPATFTEDSVARSSPRRCEETVAIHYGVPRKSVAQVGKKIYLDFCPLGQGDSKCQHVYSSLIFLLTVDV